jgi:hypothetical protein
VFREQIILQCNINKHKSTFFYTKTYYELLIDTIAARYFSINPGQENEMDATKVREYLTKPL